MEKREVKVLAFVLAGGEGKRLAPLTKEVAKPAVPFHTQHRLIDFALSNLRNSGIRTMHVLMQYRPESVLEHLTSAWQIHRPDATCFINPVIGGQGGMPHFAGTADAVYRNRREIVDTLPDLVAVFSADHIYRMDVRQMIDFHLDTGADATVAALPVPLAEARGFGVIEARSDGRIKRFAEKPQKPLPMPGRPDHALASMGNYIFSPKVLLEALEATRADGGTDFGGHLLPALVSSHRLMAYDFTTNVIEGLAPEKRSHYWRDVGTLDAYFAAHMDTLAGPGGAPRFDLAAHGWPIRGETSVFDASRRNWALGRYESLAAVAPSAAVEQIILRQGASVGAGAEVERCILGEHVEIGARCRLRNVIVESGTRVPAGFVAGFDPARDREMLTVSDGGIVVIPRSFFSTPIRTTLAHAAAVAAAEVTARVTVRAAAQDSPAGATVTQILPALNGAGAVQPLPRRRETTAEPHSVGTARA
jgi:glucose-1-phosphate adenylyltransferase